MAIVRKNDPVRLFWRRLLLVGLFVLVVAAASGVWSAYQKERESELLRAQSQGQLSDLQEQETQLNSDVATLETERGQEAALRQQYALAAKGENLIIIVNPTTTEIQATSSAFAQWLHNTFPWW